MTTQQNTQNQLALVRRDTVDVVAEKVKEFRGNGELQLPPNYSPDNAMKSAWLVLQNTQDRNKQPVLSVCTSDSIANSLLDMVVQGLNPAKKQCYFIAYGKQLVCQRSYHGAMAVVKSLCGAKDVYAQVVWKGDVFEYSINKGNKKIESHKQKLENVGVEPLAAYCVIELQDGREYTDIMTMEQIKKAWSKSKMNPSKDGSVHSEFAEEMIRKTVINRACKKYINSSSDDHLLVKSVNRADEVVKEVEFEDELSQNANAEIIDIGTGEVVDAGSSEGFEEPQKEIEETDQPAAAPGPGF